MQYGDDDAAGKLLKGHLDVHASQLEACPPGCAPWWGVISPQSNCGLSTSDPSNVWSKTCGGVFYLNPAAIGTHWYGSNWCPECGLNAEIQARINYKQEPKCKSCRRPAASWPCSCTRASVCTGTSHGPLGCINNIRVVQPPPPPGTHYEEAYGFSPVP